VWKVARGSGVKTAMLVKCSDFSRKKGGDNVFLKIKKDAVFFFTSFQLQKQFTLKRCDQDQFFFRKDVNCCSHVVPQHRFKHKQIMVILQKHITRELVNPQLLGKYIFFLNINTKFVTFLILMWK
jgi:hypothetical protein